MIGCLAFLVFAVVLHERLAAAEGGSRMFANIAFVGALAVGVFGLLVLRPGDRGGDQFRRHQRLDGGALSHLGDAFFVAAELSAILLMLGTGMVALRTGLLPKWFAWFGFLLAVVLVIGPIGWAGLIFGLPVWVLVTTFFLVRREAPASRPVALESN